MPAYTINYLHDDGTLAAKIETRCAGDTQAKVIAHSMKMGGARQIEIWNGFTLVYTRPQNGAETARIALN